MDSTAQGKNAMKLIDIIHRQPNPKPWSEGEKIPWDEPDFSKRMLIEHLSQAHDAASRRFEIINTQVDWIHHFILKGQPARILDLGCGPGLYTERLARLGHACVGIDFSPASIDYARAQAKAAGLNCQYLREDIRKADFAIGYDLVMSIYGELNVFRSEEAKALLVKSYEALAPGGYLLLEPHTFEIVVELGKQPASWNSVEKGLFSDEPYLYLRENIWDEAAKVAIQRYYIIDASTGDVTYHSSSTQAYTQAEYRSLLTDCGFTEVAFYDSMSQNGESIQNGLIIILARKPACQAN